MTINVHFVQKLRFLALRRHRARLKRERKKSERFADVKV
jgi:hypothetical protein